MLIVTRRPGERILLGDDVTVEVMEVAGGSVRLGIKAPRSLPVYREELWDAIKQENEAAVGAPTACPSPRRASRPASGPDPARRVAPGLARERKEPTVMSLRINNNPEAQNAHRNLVGTSNKMSKAMERLSSGYRINRAADDAAGLAISERLRAQIRGLGQAQRNAQDAISLVQTAEGSLTEVHAMLQRVRELAVQYKTGSIGASDRLAIQSEVNELASEISRIGTSAEFNGIKLLDAVGTVSFQVGANDGELITVATISLGTSVPAAAFSLTAGGTTDLSEIDAAISAVSTQRATFGAVQNRLEHALNNLAAYQENLVASESRIRDVDMAAEMVEFTKLQILQQAGTAMLAQANQSPQTVLSLLRG
jgi:flagellin